MRWLRIIVAVLILLLVVIGVAVGIGHIHSKKTVIEPTKQTAFPVATSSTSVTYSQQNSTISLNAKDGSKVEVQNITAAATTKPEPYTSGEYVLADDCSATDTCNTQDTEKGYRIVFDSRNDSFNIVLLAEPLKDTRLDAEHFLANILGVTPSQLCSLSISIGTIQSVNGSFAGQELGVSTCPGAVTLP